MAVDAGKSKFLVAVFGTSSTEMARQWIPVAGPGSTLRRLIEYIATVFAHYPVRSIGLSIFGPLETDPEKDDFGAIVGSSEPEWSGINLPSTLARQFGVPIFFDFDVNAGALAEAQHTRRLSSRDFIYLSIGTGIGGVRYQPQGRDFRADPPQMGHLYLPREVDDSYAGNCRFHGSCFQGLASGRAIFGRWQTPADRLPPDHKAWDMEARYIARACVNLLYVSSFTTILVSSGISTVPGLIRRSNQYLNAYLNHFPEPSSKRVADRGLIERATTAPQSSVLGAAILARKAMGLRFEYED